MAVLDSSAIIHILNGTEKGKQIEERFADELISTTSISINEVLIGLTKTERGLIMPFVKGLEVLPFDEAAAFKSIELEDFLRSKGKPIGKQDIFIASICLVHELSLVTTDKDFNNVPGLKLLTP